MSWKLVVIGVLYRCLPGSGISQILTGRRTVRDHGYDSLFHGVWEAVGETVEDGEDIAVALRRGIREELGVLIDLKALPMSARWTAGKGDLVSSYVASSQLLCYVHSLGLPQPWTGIAFGVELPSLVEPDLRRADGEVSSYRWWQPAELIRAMQREPERFMTLHLPALHQLARRLLSPDSQ